MAGHAQGEGLARPGLAHDQGDTGATLAHVTDHRLLVLTGGRVRLEGRPYCIVGHHDRCSSVRPGSGDDQPLLNDQEFGGG
jgi:hypothetical protein